MKKLLLLGGSAQQVKAIVTAKKMGYYTVLCDYLSDNPGQYEADKFYLVSTTDKGACLKVAIEENVDGIVAYSSDPAAPTAAYVAEKLHLPGIPYKIAEAFCEKYLFREFLMKHHFHVPASRELTEESTVTDLQGLHFPIIVKPTDSSGSKGVMVLPQMGEFEEAKKFALQFSRNGILIAEEFIERDHPDVIEAELFVINGKVQVWGLMNTIRDPYTNPLLPAAYSYPLNIGEKRVKLVRREISRLVEASGVSYGAFNIEMIIDKSDRLYFLDAGPRNGGNQLPEFIGGIADEDMVKTTLLAAMGEYDAIKDVLLDGVSGGYWGLSVIHTDHLGIFKGIAYDTLARKYLLHDSYLMELGQKASTFRLSRDALALSFYKFPDRSIQDEILRDFKGEHVQAVVEK